MQPKKNMNCWLRIDKETSIPYLNDYTVRQADEELELTINPLRSRRIVEIKALDLDFALLSN